MISASGINVIRVDDIGDGHYMASRKNSNGQTYSHLGVDYVCAQGADALSPISGVVKRIIRCYADTPEYLGVEIENHDCTVKVLYVEPLKYLQGKEVVEGEKIGLCQKISDRYPGCIDHLHQEIIRVNPDILVNFTL